MAKDFEVLDSSCMFVILNEVKDLIFSKDKIVRGAGPELRYKILRCTQNDKRRA